MKTCRICGLPKDAEEFCRSSKSKDGRDSRCRQCRKDAYLSVGESARESARNAYSASRSARLAQKARHHRDNRDAILQRRREAWGEDARKARDDYWNGRRRECYGILGDRCAACGQPDARVLCIDHISGDGAAERAAGGSLLKLWNKIIAEGPGGRYQLLCFNCNYKKGLAQRAAPDALGWTKKCPTCMSDKDAGLFKADRKYGDGRYYECRACSAERDSAVKRLAFLRLGSSKCACGIDDPDMLTVDHVHGDGSKRRGLDGLGASLYRKIVQGRVDRSRFQVMCFNCNILKSVAPAFKLQEVVRTVRRQGSRPSREFDLKDVVLERRRFSDIVSFLDSHHYAGCGRACTVAYAGVLRGEDIAVLKFAPPVRAEVARSIGFEPRQVLELDRMCVLPDCHRKNLLSRLLSMAVKDIAASFPDVRMLATFADPEAGHDGTVYKASGWKLVGKTSRSYVYIAPDGKEMNKKTVYDAARVRGLKEAEYAQILGLRRSYTAPKIKFVHAVKTARLSM